MGTLKRRKIHLFHLSSVNWLIRRLPSRPNATALVWRNDENPSRGLIVFASSSVSIYDGEYEDKPNG